MSLGFGSDSKNPADAMLIIVDNGSTDSTAEVAEEIRCTSKPDTVYVLQETERGFVPARHAGTLFALALAKSKNLDAENVLILQVDADCEYLPGYISSMREAVEGQASNLMIEACLGYPPVFQKEYAEYVRICDQTDVEFENLFPRSLSHDDVAVDAVCGYRLADYLKWGGHRREFNARGEEIYAETTRMFMRARTYGAQRFRVEGALALHSARKACAHPALHLATGGFPREESWNRRWQEGYTGPKTISDLCAQSDHPEVARAVRVRQEHLLALFAVLPLHIDRALGQLAEGGPETQQLAAHILPLLPYRNIEDLASRPGILIADVFDLILAHGLQLLNHARQLTSEAQR
jgi:hypothetical protein